MSTLPPEATMPPLLDRLRSALAPQLHVERELATGGMGAVFVAHDPALDRRVAVKILRPEIATARAVERFLREGRILASLHHPNIVPVHQAGEADGLFFYVMDLLQGETLAQRIARGPLPLDEARRIGADVLAGLSHAHAHGVIHRDIKPDNIFFEDGRAMLADFGIAKSELTSDTRTRTGAAPGSPAYMAPEQQRGESSERSDIHSTGAVLFEALTSRRWSDVDPGDERHWRTIPEPLALAIRRALEWTPERRWQSAEEFRAELTHIRRSPSRRRLAVATVLALLLGGVYWSAALRSGETPAVVAAPGDLALLPLETTGDLDPMIGRDVALLAALALDGLPQFTVVPPRSAFHAANRAPPLSDAEFAQHLNARFIARGSIARVEGGYEARVLVLEPRTEEARPLITVRTLGADHTPLADALARELVRSIHPRLAGSQRLGTTLSSDVRALREFLAGEYAVQRNAWHSAEQHYMAAIALDSTFAHAHWRLANARRWLPRWEHGASLDMAAVYRDNRDQFSERDRMLLEAEIAPPGPERLARFERAAQRYPSDAYALLLFADELFHRGPLFGEPLERAVTVLEEAAAIEPLMATAHEHLAWAHILLGNREGARRAVEAFTRTAAPPERGAVYAPAVFQFALRARFEPERTAESSRALTAGDPATTASWLSYTVRYGLAFGIPEAQLEVGRLLAAMQSVSPSTRAIALEAQAHALLALGRGAEAFARLDSVASIRATPEAFAEAASWRVIPAALGWNVATAEERERGRRSLERLAASADHGAAIHWALALDAVRHGDATRSATWVPRAEARLPTESSRTFQSTLAAARASARNDLRSAIAISAPLPGFLPASSPGSMARAARHVLRAGWHEAVGDLESAEREWIWADNTDQLGLAREGAAAGEVDRVFGTFATYRRGMLALRRGDAVLACRLLGSVARLWRDADPQLQPLVEEARAGAARSCAA